MADSPRYLLGDSLRYLPGDLEVLTSLGFKKLEDLKQTDLIAQHDVAAECVKFLQPLSIKSIIRKLDCIELRRDTQSQEPITVLPVNTIVPLGLESNLVGKRLALVPVGQVTKSALRNLLRTTRLDPSGPGRFNRLSYIDRLNIAIQADGSVTKPQKGLYDDFEGRVSFSFSKSAKMDKLEEILESVGAVFDVSDSYVGSSEEVIVARYSVATPFRVYKRFEDWVNLANKGNLWLRLFLNELQHWDCHKSAYGLQYSNKCWSDISIVQAIAVLAGHDTSISLASASGVYSLNINMTGTVRKLGLVATPVTETKQWFRIAPASKNALLVVRGNRTVFLVSGD